MSIISTLCGILREKYETMDDDALDDAFNALSPSEQRSVLVSGLIIDDILKAEV